MKPVIMLINITYCFVINIRDVAIDFAGKIFEIIGRQKQRAKFWYDRSKFKQNIPS